MKQALLIINALLVVAVSYLLYKQCTNGTCTKSVAAEAAIDNKDSAGNRKFLFAYMNMDSVQTKYELAKRVTNEVDKRREALDAEITKMDRAYRSKLEGYQQRAATMTEEQAIAARDDMQKTEHDMMERKQSLAEQYQSWLASRNMSVIKDIKDFLKKFNADKTYSFILSYEPGLFYYSDSAYDITREVIKGLNEQYKANKK